MYELCMSLGPQVYGVRTFWVQVYGVPTFSSRCTVCQVLHSADIDSIVAVPRCTVYELLVSFCFQVCGVPTFLSRCTVCQLFSCLAPILVHLGLVHLGKPGVRTQVYHGRSNVPYNYPCQEAPRPGKRERVFFFFGLPIHSSPNPLNTRGARA